MTSNFTDAELAKFWVEAQKVGRAKARLAYPAQLELQRQRYATDEAVREYQKLTGSRPVTIAEAEARSRGER